MRRQTAVVGSVLALMCAALAGCSTMTGGRPVPADPAGPRPVPPSALPEVLLDVGTVNEIMGAAQMTVKDSRSQPFEAGRQFPDHSCMAAWTPAERSVYAASGWTAVFAQTLLESVGEPDHFVVQAVTAFDSRDSARDFFDKTAQQWLPCGNRTFVTSHDGGVTTTSWTFDEVADIDATVWMTQKQDDSPGWSCQRALRVSNNVAIDVLACKLFATDEAVTIAHTIDSRLPTV